MNENEIIKNTEEEITPVETEKKSASFKTGVIVGAGATATGFGIYFGIKKLAKHFKKKVNEEIPQVEDYAEEEE